MSNSVNVLNIFNISMQQLIATFTFQFKLQLFPGQHSYNYFVKHYFEQGVLFVHTIKMSEVQC